MCKELDCVIRHIPSELNYADSIKLGFDRGIDAKEVEASLKSNCVMALDVDGIDLPELTGCNPEEVEELQALERYATPDGRYGEGVLNDADYERICYLDQDGLIHRKPSDPDETERDQITGVLYLGESDYSDRIVRLLSAIYHYIYGHLGIPRVYDKIKMKYSRKGLKRLVRSTLRSCIPCLKARAARSLDYVTTHVQGLLTTGLWQVVGADLAGPYGRRQGTQGDDDEEHYLLLVHDHASGFTCARPLKDSKPKTIAKVLHSVFCEHGAPRVLITDRDRVHLMRKEIKVVLAKHGVRYYTLPGYAQFLSFWERAHKDFVEVTRALTVSMDRSTESSYIEDYQLAVIAYNITPRIWANDMTLRPGTEIDDLRLLQRARKKMDLEKIVRESGRVRDEFGSELLLSPGICPSDEETQQLEDRLLPPESFIMGDSEEGVPSEDEDPDEEDMVDLSRLREQLGVGDDYEFRRFMKKAPPNGSDVVVADNDYDGLATVLEGDAGTEDGSMLVQPMRVELLGGCLELAKATDEDILTVQLDNMVYVSPCGHKWTRQRSRDLLKLLHDVQVPHC
ncbi:hypothetical protein Pmar_PMAR005469 [Perkinsus marinus ATCC 50983]|uniref:Integrase catalytic domain-containing protein n=1 Tax=Perkinsus marinus (strain ATCC 50983 / TXsc) TaxID=423536 RepID=C5KND0_PERM5|nr:hypothetical protein Pmar_PMAR005469 [Perkinsus marinus ATCC 50983]EER14024.1 hypothetical protein Pmar_PMAR005469 [Perkinsus marinus ATCC 50983]|eukprot:XP_002782229.1 hypothetical protein Pmar_PMAR005469 [Perkinsus marinus ATCC 50983]